MSASAKPLTLVKFETVKRRLAKNTDTLVDPQVALRLALTVELHQARLRRCLTGRPVEAWT